MLHVFANTDERPIPGTGKITPYINLSITGLPAAADDADEKMFSILSRYGTPVSVPDGLDVTVMASNAFLVSLLA